MSYVLADDLAGVDARKIPDRGPVGDWLRGRIGARVGIFHCDREVIYIDKELVGDVEMADGEKYQLSVERLGDLSDDILIRAGGERLI